MSQIAEIVLSLGKLAKNAAHRLRLTTKDEKNRALLAIAEGLKNSSSHIKAQNQIDLKLALEEKMPASLVDRLVLDDKRIDGMTKSIHEIIDMPDPIGKLLTSKTLENGLILNKIRAPIGVIGIIFESRPNVLSDVAALCLKSGNAVILRGGKEAQHTNRAIMDVVEEALKSIDFCPFAVQMVPVNDREAVQHLCRLNDYVDLIIPRGGEALIKAVSEGATVPVIKHYKGLCHVYVDDHADLAMAEKICVNAKVQRPGVCNAAETFLIHEKVAPTFLPKLAKSLLAEKVELRLCSAGLKIYPEAKAASEEDWSIEYLDLVVSIKIVKDINEAIRHINHHGSHHSDAIVSEDKNHQVRFSKEVDSAAVYINASTRFTDGGVFGLGAEIGISTDKIHARGPMGLNELTTYKWVGLGSGQIR